MTLKNIFTKISLYMAICCVQECRLLLLSLTVVSLLPATPELAIRSTVSLSPEHSVGSN